MRRHPGRRRPQLPRLCCQEVEERRQDGPAFLARKTEPSRSLLHEWPINRRSEVPQGLGGLARIGDLV